MYHLQMLAGGELGRKQRLIVAQAINIKSNLQWSLTDHTKHYPYICRMHIFILHSITGEIHSTNWPMTVYNSEKEATWQMSWKIINFIFT